MYYALALAPLAVTLNYFAYHYSPAWNSMFTSAEQILYSCVLTFAILTPITVLILKKKLGLPFSVLKERLRAAFVWTVFCRNGVPPFDSDPFAFFWNQYELVNNQQRVLFAERNTKRGVAVLLGFLCVFVGTTPNDCSRMVFSGHSQLASDCANGSLCIRSLHCAIYRYMNKIVCSYRNSRMASRKMTRKANRKTRTRKASTRKASSGGAQTGGKRSEWLKKVMRVYKDMKARDSSVKLGDAMKAAAKMK
jgi:hypothetical protein